METDLEKFIASSPLCSTHEHIEFRKFYDTDRPDILCNLFENYVLYDLRSAGASPQEITALLDKTNPDIRSRFLGVERYWKRVESTGYGQAVRKIAGELYQIDDLKADNIEIAARQTWRYNDFDERLHILRDVANLDHVQIDPSHRILPREMAGQNFFLYDLNAFEFCNGTPDLASLRMEIGRDILNLEDLNEAMSNMFERCAPYAVAIKSQHAYGRTLFWQERGNADAQKALDAWRAGGPVYDDSTRLCLGDWCTSKVAELSIKYNLPFKMHTGYYATNGILPVDYIKAGNLCGLLRRYPEARFLLMHIAYPYSDELIAMAKNFSNVSIDMCWAWSMNPYHSSDFFLRYLNAAPLNKLFIFGGDAIWPAATLGYALQARDALTNSLQKAVNEGLFDKTKAIEHAQFLMMDNVYDYFDLHVKKARQTKTPQTEIAQRTSNMEVFQEPVTPVRISGKSPV